MRKSILTAVTVFCFSSIVSAQPVIVVDTMTGGLCHQPTSMMQQFLPATQIISIMNPDAVLKSISLAFKVYSPDGGTVDDLQLSFFNGFDSLFNPPGQGLWIQSGITQIGDSYEVSIVIPEWSGEGEWGLPVSTEAIPYIGLSLQSGYAEEGISLCVDSTTTSYVTEWAITPGPAIAFSGPRCHDVVDGLLANCSIQLHFFIDHSVLV